MMNAKGKIYSASFSISIIVAGLILLNGCDYKKKTFGSLDRVIVVADSVLWRTVADRVSRVVEKKMFTPQPEKIFTIVHKNPEELGNLTRYSHIMLIGTLESEGRTKMLLDQMLTPEAVTKIESDSSFIFQKHDAWARDQLLLVLVSRDIQTLEKRLDEDDGFIFDLYDEHTRKTVTRHLFTRFEKKDVERQLLNKHGWQVRVQADFFVAVDSSEARYVWLRRFNPQRWLSITWQETDNPSLLNRQWMLDRRKKIGEDYYAGDYVYQDSLIQIVEKEVDFNGRYAIRLDGLWKNDEHMMGGPFRSYGFYDENDNRLYYIDIAVYAPGEKKWYFMRQLDAVASTFRTRDELTAEEG